MGLHLRRGTKGGDGAVLGQPLQQPVWVIDLELDRLGDIVGEGRHANMLPQARVVRDDVPVLMQFPQKADDVRPSALENSCDPPARQPIRFRPAAAAKGKTKKPDADTAGAGKA